ncbi:beta strand repeat-containing protein [Sediminicola luteus]|uniref:Uncharacterized protein n=1 Tax=Sediminicola luteus TaxID=319238 RepID=A0ABV2U145_9FLAO
MNYKHFFVFSFLLLSSITYSQIKIGDNPQNISASSVLELESTSRAFVLTRVNNTQMNAITPLQGALIYNTDSKCVHYYDGTQWLNLCDALTNSGNISLVDNGDGTYTFSDANSNITEINNLNESLVVEDGNLTLTDSAGNTVSVELQDLNSQTFTTDPIINTFPTIFITQDASGTNFNFEVGIIDGENIQDGSIKQADLAGSSVGSAQLRDNSVRNVAMADNAIGSPEIINGSIQPIDIGPGTTNQILTTNGAGAVQWIDKTGLVAADDVSYDNASSSLSATNVQDALDEVNAANGTINLVDNLDGTYTFTKSDGTTITITDTSISTLTDNGDGTYTYTDETGAVQTIDTNGITITNLISGNRIGTISKADGTSSDINETITTVTGTAATGKAIATYSNESGTAVIINETITNLTDTNDGFITFTNENGTVQKVSKSNIIDNGNGTYTFTNNDGSDVTIDTNGVTITDVIAGNLIATVTDAAGTVTEIDETITTVTGTAATGKAIATYSNENGTAVIINETVTNLTDTNDGFITYTNENGTVQKVNKSDIIDNGNGTYTFTNNDGSDVTIDTNGIAITNVIAGNLIATVTDAAGTATEIDETITTVTGTAATGKAIATYSNESGTSVIINETVTNLTDTNDGFITFSNENGTVQKVNKSDIIDNGNGTYTFTNNDGSDVTIDTNGVAITDVIAGNLIATVTDAAGTVTEIDETITTVTGTAATGKAIATYSNENGTSVIINETVTNLTDTNDGFITFTNENGTVQKVNKSDLIDNGNGTYNFTNNDGSDVTIDTRAVSNPFTSSSGLTSLNVQGAIDEINTNLNTLSIGNVLTQGNDAQAQLIRNVLDPSAPQDVATMNYVDTKVGELSTLDDGKIYVGDGSNNAQDVFITGDVLMNNSGLVTIQPNVINSNKILNETILSEDIANGTIATVDIANDAIDNSKLADDAVQIENILNGAANQILRTNSAGNAVEWGAQISTDAGNVITAGTDGGAFYDDSTIQSNIATNTTNITSNDTDIANNTTAIATKEDAANKSSDDTFATADNVNFPTQLAVKTYVDTQVATVNTDDDITAVNFDGTSLTVEEGTTSFSADLSALEESADIAAVQADVDANETAANNAIAIVQADVDQNEADADTAIALKEDAANKSSDDTFVTADNVNFPTQLAVKTYVDTQVATVNTDDDITAVNFDGTSLTVEEGTTSFSADLSALEESADIAAVQADVDANETAANNAIAIVQADVDQNEADADAAIALKEDAANKSSDDTFAAADNINFPTQLAVKTYVDNQVATITTDDDITAVSFDGTSLTVEEGTTTFSADLSALEESADIAAVQADVDQNEADADTAIALKEDAANKSSDDTFATADNVNFPTQLAVKTYVDNEITASNQTIVSGDAGNDISASITDGGAFYDDSDADPLNEIQNINEVLADGNNAGGLLIKNIGTPVDGTDAVNKDYVDNAITASNPVKAYGYINFTIATPEAYGAGYTQVLRTALGRYTITFGAGNEKNSTKYIIQLTHFGSGFENVDIFVSNQTTTTFDINITQSGGYVDRIFYFTVLDF